VSQVLQDVTDHDEQVELLRLLEQYQLDNVSIVNEQLQYALDRNIGEAIDTPLKMLEYNTSPVTYPGQCIVPGFFSHDPAKEDEAVVRSLRWFTIIEGHWADLFSALSLAMRKCLGT
jgi:nuclear pore complex protein Nup107